MFHGKMNWIETSYTIDVAFYTLFYLIMFAFGLCILGKKFKRNNVAVIIYVILMFFIGFLSMAV